MSTTLLIFLVLVLVIVIVVQLARAGELLSIARGAKEGEVSAETNRALAYFMIAFLILGMIGGFWSVAYYKPLFLPAASSVHGVAIDELFNITLLFTGIVFIITQILVFWFAFRYRGGSGRKAYYFPHSNKLELIWTVVPSVVMTVLVIMGLRTWFHTLTPSQKPELEVEAIAEQFNWTIRYAGKDGKLGKRHFEKISAENPLGIDWSDENSHDDFITAEIHLPVDKLVLFRLSAKDVLHSFFLPHFRVKMDCVPGIPTQFPFTPTETTEKKRNELNDPNFMFFLACAELCGVSHWNMRRNLFVETEEEFQKWADEQKPAYDAGAVKVSLENKKDNTQDNSEKKDEQTGEIPVSAAHKTP